MKVVLSHATGNANVRAVLSGLYRSGALAEFNTTLAINPTSSYVKLLPKSLREDWLRRAYSLPNDYVNSFPLLELARMFLPRIGLRNVTSHEHKFASIDAVYTNLDKIVSRRLDDLVKRKKTLQLCTRMKTELWRLLNKQSVSA